MERAYTFYGDIIQEIDIPVDGMLSKTLYDDTRVKIALFAIAVGQEFTEPATSAPTVLHFLRGTARLTLGDDTRETGVGTWVHVQPDIPYTVYAITPVVILFQYLKETIAG